MPNGSLMFLFTYICIYIGIFPQIVQFWYFPQVDSVCITKIKILVLFYIIPVFKIPVREKKMWQSLHLITDADYIAYFYCLSPCSLHKLEDNLIIIQTVLGLYIQLDKDVYTMLQQFNSHLSRLEIPM